MSLKTAGGLTVAKPLHDFIVNEALPGTGLDADALFGAMASIIEDLGPKNQAMLDARDVFQSQLDDWHKANPGPIEPTAYKKFLSDIGYLVEPVADFS
ncbi:MAG: malate synthase G, partial [Granulosicoccus sp.]